MSDTQGNFVWYELMTSDVNGAIKFYKDVIGWGTQAFEGGEMPYTMWTVGETPLGGVMTLPDEAKKMGAPPHWLAYVAADDVDALTKKAASLGAKTYMPPKDIPKVGRFSIIADPQGAVIALFKGSGPEMPRAAEATNGHFSWHELIAGEWESAFRFYSQLFGWQKTDAMDMGPMGTSLPIPPKRVGQLDTAALPEFWQHLTLRRELDALAGGRGSGWRRLDARRKSATARSRSPA